MTDRLAVIILDALDADNLRKLDMPFLQNLYAEKGQVLTCSTFPVTHSSNPMIWGGIEDNDLHWIEHEEAEPPFNPARFWRESDGALVEEARFYTREDYKETFIWDDLVAQGHDARALEIPVVIPPYSFNVEKSLDDCWFPANEDQMHCHIRHMTDLIQQNLEDGCDFLAASIHVPDAWFHKIGEGKTEMDWVRDESAELDDRLEKLVEHMESESIDYMIFGDHGSPQDGQAIDGDYILTKHRKESIIISNLDEVPKYTDQLYQFMLDYFDAEEVDYGELGISNDQEDVDESEVKDRLQGLGYI